MPDDYVTLATFATSPEAEAARLRIESEGIPAILTDTEIVNMDWMLGNAVGYIKLQIPPDQVVAATAILDQIAAERRERLNRRAEAGDNGDDADDSTCLACGAAFPEDADRCPECNWSWQGERE